MASPKENRQSAAEFTQSQSTLAEQLFSANWSPQSGYTSERLAEQCHEAAEAFYRVRRAQDKTTPATN